MDLGEHSKVHETVQDYEETPGLVHKNTQLLDWLEQQTIAEFTFSGEDNSFALCACRLSLLVAEWAKQESGTAQVLLSRTIKEGCT